MAASSPRARTLGVAAATAFTLLATACAPSDGGSNGAAPGGTVSVMGSWSGAEQDSFLAMVAPWEQRTGTRVQYTGTRDLSTQITSGIASGNLPDIAGLPGPAVMKGWYDQGALQPLSFVDFARYSAATPAGFAELGQVDGQLLGVFTKASVKGLIYYNTNVWRGEDPATWDALVQQVASSATAETSPWCVGLESGATSGWPGTDWIEDILLRQSGPRAYDALVAGDLAWTSPEVRRAFETFGEVLRSSHGGPQYVVNTNFGRAANPMFASPPGCLLHHQASFITDFFANEAGAQPGSYGFFAFPDIEPEYARSVTGGGDLLGMFHDTPQARSLIEYLLTAEAQQIWVERGGFISANSAVPMESYPDDASRRAAEVLRNAQTFRFDASDQLPSAVEDAFLAGVLGFAQNQADLDRILGEIDAVRVDNADG